LNSFIFVADQGDGGFIGNVFIYNNIFTFAHGKSIAFERINNAGIYYNTFYKWNPTLSNSQTFISLGGAYDRNITLKNNIIYNDAERTINRGLHSFLISYPDESSYHSDYNLFYNSDPGLNTILFINPETDYPLTSWDQYVSENAPNDEHSLAQQDPLFVDGDDGNFHLQSSSPALHAGNTDCRNNY